MKQSPTCKSCKFFEDGLCHESPPQTTIAIVPQPPSLASRGGPQMGPMAFSSFPPISNPDEMWCGKYNPSFKGIPQ